MVLFTFALLLLLPWVGYSQSSVELVDFLDDVSAPPTDFGAGYKIIMFNQDREHAPAADDDSDQQGPVKLAIEYPLIASPLTPQAKFYNAAIAQFIPRWWKDFGGPKDNSQTADPNTIFPLFARRLGSLPNMDCHLKRRCFRMSFQ